ncbi:MAG: sulfatase [bacterium]|nr:sulfatase [bacterium]
MSPPSPMTRREALKVIGAGAATLALGDLLGCAGGGGGARQPNVLVILTDDVRFDSMGCAGDKRLETPNLDRLASEGVRFSNAFVTTSLCSPSRASMLTGCYAHRHGVLDNVSRDPDRSCPTFAQLLQGAGYETAYFGKWHMLAKATPRAGFDRWISFTSQGEYVRNTMNFDGDWRLVLNYITDELTDHAVGFLEQERTKPFLLVVGHKAAHAPFVPATRHEKRYAGIDFTTSDDIDGDLTRKPDWGSRGEGELSAEDLRNYHRCLLSVDESVGRLVGTLRDRKLLDDTIIIYTSDNGLMLGEHGGLRDKRAAYEASIRVPLLMRHPKLAPRGRVCGEMALGLDLLPTFCEAAGVAIPATSQGRSLLPLARGDRGRDDFLYEYFREEGNVPTCLAVRSRDWKYISYPEDPALPVELYDLKNDPHERHNLAGQPEHGTTQHQLAMRLAALLQETGYRRPGA